jgi:hypothetical protein
MYHSVYMTEPLANLDGVNRSLDLLWQKPEDREQFYLWVLEQIALGAPNAPALAAAATQAKRIGVKTVPDRRDDEQMVCVSCGGPALEQHRKYSLALVPEDNDNKVVLRALLSVHAGYDDKKGQ